jgi:hypothetical protein
MSRGGTGAPQVLWWVIAPQCGAQTPPAPHPVFGRQLHPGAHWLEDEQVGKPLQNTFSMCWQQPSVLMKQKQQPVPPGHVWPKQPPQAMHDVDAGELAPAVDAVNIDPAPSAAAPTPARLSRRPLVTRCSDTAMQTNLLIRTTSVLAQLRDRVSIPRTGDLDRQRNVGLLRR